MYITVKIKEKEAVNWQGEGDTWERFREGS